MNELIPDFCKAYNFSREEASILIKNMELIEIKKNEKIIEQGKCNSDLYLINSGIMRVYTVVDSQDITEWFASRANLVFSIWSYANNLKSRTTIETITDTTAYYISRAKLLELFNSSIKSSNLGRKLIEQYSMITENWLMDWEKPTAKTRYLTLMKMDPEIIKNVPLQQIASYLRITPQSLSRIRAQL